MFVHLGKPVSQLFVRIRHSYESSRRITKTAFPRPSLDTTLMENPLQVARHTTLAFLVLFLSSVLYSQANPSTASPLPYTPSLDPTAMDRSVGPCVDFYRYSCGTWSKKNPIPPDRTAWMVYSKAYEDNLVLLHSVLEQAATAQSRDSITQKVGDFYEA